MPPPASTVGRCVDSGVLGVGKLLWICQCYKGIHTSKIVPGVIGILQALEAIKVAIGSPSKKKKSIELRRYS